MDGKPVAFALHAVIQACKYKLNPDSLEISALVKLFHLILASRWVRASKQGRVIDYLMCESKGRASVSLLD